jgi:Zn finger protein HypA/HybF involved in hydrogenase expression
MNEPEFHEDEIEDDESEPVCHHCRGDGMDPYTDYLLPCPVCQSEQQL